MADKKDVSEIVNPKKTIERRIAEAEMPRPNAGVDKGNIPGSTFDFFKGGPKDRNAAGLEKALKERK